MSDFSDRPLAVGTLTGLRAFQVDSFGRLTSPQQDAIFKPGENLATCRRDVFAMGGLITRSYLASALVPIGYEESKPPKEKPEHRCGDMSCSCGWYAYTNGTNDYHRTGETVEALVEGYGLCTVGRRGFRAEKARLIALVEPERRRITKKAIDAKWFGPVLAGIIGGCMSGGYSAIFQHNAYGFIFPVLGALLLLFLTVRHNRKVEYEPAVDLTKTKAIYPDVPIYPNLQAALAAHPLSAPPALGPDDPEFWTQREL